MRSHTAIIHLNDAPDPELRARLELMSRSMAGIDEACLDVVDPVMTLGFDQDRIELPQIVRAIEDAGAVVLGVALRSASNGRLEPSAPAYDH